MNPPQEILATLLRGLGFTAFEIIEEESLTGTVLQVLTEESEPLIGREGEGIDDLQFLLNRILQARDPQSPKAHIDIARYREGRNRRLIDTVMEAARLVRETGQPYHLEPMQAYERRIVHRAFLNDPEITTWSPADDARIKRITLMRRP